MNRLILLTIILAVNFAGCFQRHPLPYEYEGWQKKDGYPYFRTEAQKKLDEIEVQKALLECGYPSPLGGGGGMNDMDKMTIRGRCMEKAGFIDFSYINSFGKTWCQDYPNPACNLPLSQIPDRNISMRLNSKWCTKLYPQADACQP